MNKWLPLYGNFESRNNTIVFHGGVTQNTMNSTSILSETAKFGLLLFEDVLSTGEIEFSFRFDSYETSNEAEIVFNYIDNNNFYCAGVSSAQAKYEIRRFNNQWIYLASAGVMDKLPTNEFIVKLRIFGSMVEMYINEIKILSTIVPPMLLKTNIGIWTRSKSDIVITDFKTNAVQPQVFIISQFGNDYDILYEDVIKPIIKEHKYVPIRADEISTCTTILSDIISSIHSASIIIADVTPDNPNVFYELGFAHAINKPTILLCEKGIRSKLPFDISGFRTIFYDNSIGGKKQIEAKLHEYLNNIAVPLFT